VHILPAEKVFMERKREGGEHQTLEAGKKDYYEQEYCALKTRLIEEAAGTSLPASPTAQSALSDMLVRVRLASVLNRE
jgi:hypothetical protein